MFSVFAKDHGRVREIPLCIEGKQTVDGRYLVPGALRFPEGPVPVTTPGPRHGNEVVGKAEGFRRGEDGVVYGTVTLEAGSPIDLDNVNSHIEVSDPEYDDRGGPGVGTRPLVIERGTLRGVYLSAGPGGWPQIDRVTHTSLPAVGRE